MVTGALGFIGSHLTEALLDKDEQVVGVSHPTPPENNINVLTSHKAASNLRIIYSDLKNLYEVEQIMKTNAPTHVYHLAALASHRLSMSEPYKYLENNILTTLNILEAARITEPSPRIVFSSSSSIYGNNTPPLREDMKPDPRGPYALSKWICEELCSQYVRDYGLNVVTVRYFNVVGERCRGNIVFRVFAEHASKNIDLEVYGRYINGVFKPAARDFTYVKDAVQGTILAAEKGGKGEVYNIGFGRPVSVKTVAELIIKNLGSRSKIVEKELKPHESLESYSDNTKARKQLGWKPVTDIEEMVKKFTEYWKNTTHDPLH